MRTTRSRTRLTRQYPKRSTTRSCASWDHCRWCSPRRSTSWPRNEVPIRSSLFGGWQFKLQEATISYTLSIWTVFFSLMRLQERGHVRAAQGRVGGSEPACSGRTPRALALGQAAPAFALLAEAALLSMLILFIEILWYRLVNLTWTKLARYTVNYKWHFFLDLHQKNQRRNGN